VREKREAIDCERGGARVADVLGGGVDLSELPPDEPLPESLLPEVSSVNRQRVRVETFAGDARRGYTLRELVVAAQGHRAPGRWPALASSFPTPSRSASAPPSST
jgi:hypothetical protein